MKNKKILSNVSIPHWKLTLSMLAFSLVVGTFTLFVSSTSQEQVRNADEPSLVGLTKDGNPNTQGGEMKGRVAGVSDDRSSTEGGGS